MDALYLIATLQGLSNHEEKIEFVVTEHRRQSQKKLPETARLTLSLEQNKDVAHTDGTLHVADNGALVLKELHTHLGHGTTAASAAKHLRHLTKLGFGVLSRRHLSSFLMKFNNNQTKKTTKRKKKKKDKKAFKSNPFFFFCFFEL